MTDRDVLADALERFEEAEDGSALNREDYIRDVRFARLGDQWPDQVLRQREKEGRPALTINRLPSFIRQVVNEARQNKPGITVSPVDGGADEDTARVVQGLVRHIERRSNADVAYDTAIEQAVSGGFGFFRIGIDYTHEDSFDLEAFIERIPNALMVHHDPNSTRFDASDWEYAFVSDFLSPDEFEAEYPDADPVSWEGDTRDSVNYWLHDDEIRVAEYWLRESERRKLLLLSDGRAIRESVLADAAKQTAEQLGLGAMSDDEALRGYLDLTGLQIVREREALGYKVTRRVMNKDAVLKEDAWPGTKIPVVPVWGDEVIVDGRRHFRSMIADARDPQQMYNYWRSATTELVALAPRAPWVMPENALPQAGAERAKWLTANTRSHAYLTYNASAGAPVRTPFASIPTGAMQEALTAVDDMKATTGIYDASLGAQGNEISGRAIMARQREGDVSNFHFIDNLNRSIRYAGEVLVEIIPAVYGPRQTIRILGEDMREEVVALTQEDGGGEIDPETGKRDLYNLNIGRYDVTVDSGPSYATQREEAREVLVEMFRARPELVPILGDLFMDNLHFQGADEAAKRLRAMLPPQVQAAVGMTPQPGMPAQPGMQPPPGPMPPAA